MAEASTPAPAAGTQTQTQQPAAPTQPPADTTDWKAKYEETQRIADLQKKEKIVERRKHETERQTLGEKLSKLSEYERTHANAKLNPIAFAKATLGDNWYETLVEAKLNGTAPADIVQAELDKRDAKWEAKFREKEEAERAQRQQQQNARLVEDERQMRAQWGKGVSEEKHFALLARHGDAAAVGSAAFDYAKAHWSKTAKYDDEGRWVQGTGEVLPFEKAAELLEAKEREFATKTHSRLTPAANSGSTPTSKQQSPKQQSPTQQGSSQQRVTLSTSINASSANTASRLTREEALKKADAKYRELQKKP